jgi:methylglutaconyl-CoA hydratase
VHEVVPADELLAARNGVLDNLLLGGPAALAEAKNLISYISNATTKDEKVVRDTAGHIARVRATDEGQEGVAAFLNKRKPSWVRE